MKHLWRITITQPNDHSKTYILTTSTQKPDFAKLSQRAVGIALEDFPEWHREDEHTKPNLLVTSIEYYGEIDD